MAFPLGVPSASAAAAAVSPPPGGAPAFAAALADASVVPKPPAPKPEIFVIDDFYDTPQRSSPDPTHGELVAALLEAETGLPVTRLDWERDGAQRETTATVLDRVAGHVERILASRRGSLSNV